MKFLMTLVRVCYPFLYMILIMQFLLLMFSHASAGGEKVFKLLHPVIPALSGIANALAFPMLVLCNAIGSVLPDFLRAWFPVAGIEHVFTTLGHLVAAVPLMEKAGNGISDFYWSDYFGGGFHWAYLFAVVMWRTLEKHVEKVFQAVESALFEMRRSQTSDELMKGFQRGDYLPKAKKDQRPVSVIMEPKKKAPEFREVVDTLKGEVSGLKERVNTDPLTKLYNKAYFNNTLAKEVEVLRPMQGTLAVAIIDIDDFKKLNDTYGHPQGDKVLIAVAEQLQALRVKSGSIVQCRIGGEELGLLFIGVDPAEAGRVVESFRQNVEKLRFPHPSHPDGNIEVTVSIGLFTVRFSESTESALLRAADMSQRADEMLYRSKAQGKNRVTTWNVE